MMEILAPAKVNLSLRVLGKRPDGYHEIESLVQKVDLCDRVILSPRAGRGIAFSCDRPELSGPDNLAARAAGLLIDRLGLIRGVSLRLEKRIPAGAGLGGGSSDAAAVLLGLSRLWDLGLPVKDLARLGSELGSDVPLFFHPSPSVIRGRGEMVEPVPVRLDAVFLIVYPGFGVSTTEAYRNFRLTTGKGKDRISRLFRAGQGGIPPDTWEEILVNDLEEGVLPSHPAIARWKESILRAGARVALMSGSGSSIFGLFEDEETARSAAARLRGGRGVEVFIARPLSVS